MNRIRCNSSEVFAPPKRVFKISKRNCLENNTFMLQFGVAIFAYQNSCFRTESNEQNIVDEENQNV